MINYNNIPKEMKEFNNWVLYKKVKRDNNKYTKQPYQVNGRLANVSDSKTWNSFDNVIKVLKTNKNYSGIGFVFTKSPFIGVDIDHCYDGENFTDESYNILAKINSYAEFSPSGEGVHIIVKGDVDITGGKNTKIGLEMYNTGRYFTVTGNVIKNYETLSNDVSGFMDIYNRYITKEKNNHEERELNNPPQNNISSRIDETVDDIINNIRKSRQSELFSRLFDDGDTSNYNNDDSSADMALMNILPFWTGGDITKMLAIFNKSALARRDKWQKRKDYQGYTINKALKSWNGKIYDPKEEHRKQEEMKAINNDMANFIKDNDIHKTVEDLQELAYFNQSDTGNAERLKYIYGDRLKHCTVSDKWLKWDGMRWKFSDSKEGTELYNMVSDIMRLSANQYEIIYGLPMTKAEENKRQAYKAFFKRSENQYSIINTIKRARAFFPVDINKLDTNAWFLNCTNGTIDLKTGELLKHNKEDLITKVCDTRYIKGATSDLWEKTIKQILPNNDIRKYVQKFIGYSLTGLTREEKFLFLYGEGGGGKGTFIETIGKVLGDYADTIPIDILLTARNDAGTGNEPAPQIAKMAGKRLVLTSESSRGRKFNDAKIKLLTGGDRITARFLRCEPFTFTPTCKFIMSSNFLPAVTDTTDKGIKRRLIIIPFNANLENVRDLALKEKLLLPQNREAILYWCIEGCLLWQKEGLGSVPDEIKKMLIDYYDENDLIGEFISSCCIVNKDSRVKVKELLTVFNTWADDGSRWHGMRLGTFKDDMKRRGFKTHKFTNGLHFMGIELINEKSFF